jgi:hypothetical protein
MTETKKRPSLAEERQKLSPEQAREQAAEALGFLAQEVITAGGEEFVIPQRGLMDDDQREAVDEVDLEFQQCDREPDVEITRPDGSTYTLPGNVKLPYRKDGVLMKPSYAVRIAQAILGEEAYKRYKAKGGRATDITVTLQRLDMRIEEREKIDSKSAGGDD